MVTQNQEEGTFSPLSQPLFDKIRSSNNFIPAVGIINSKMSFQEAPAISGKDLETPVLLSASQPKKNIETVIDDKALDGSDREVGEYLKGLRLHLVTIAYNDSSHFQVTHSN